MLINSSLKIIIVPSWKKKFQMKIKLGICRDSTFLPVIRKVKVPQDIYQVMCIPMCDIGGAFRYIEWVFFLHTTNFFLITV